QTPAGTRAALPRRNVLRGSRRNPRYSRGHRPHAGLPRAKKVARSHGRARMMPPEMKAPIDERTLVDYSDRALPPERQAEVERHLAEDPDARVLVDRYRSDIAVLRHG